MLLRRRRGGRGTEKLNEVALVMESSGGAVVPVVELAFPVLLALAPLVAFVRKNARRVCRGRWDSCRVFL